MSEDIVDEPFDAAARQIEASHEQAVAELKEKVAKAKSAALKRVTS